MVVSAVDQGVQIEPGGRSARVRGLQTAGRVVDDIGPGHRVAVNLAGIDHHELGRGHAVVLATQWRGTDRLDASLDVLGALDHDVSRRGAFVAYFGSGEHPARVRVLGDEGISPGAHGAVRLFLPERLPLLPGDRFVLRESGRDETVGGGVVLDIDPVLRASRAAPDRTIERVVRERSWVTVDDVEQLTGERVAPTVGQWLTTDDELASMRGDVLARVEAAGAAGLDVATFDERERAVLATMAEVVVDATSVRPADAVDPVADHPYLDVLLVGGFTPPQPDGVDRGELRELVRRGHVVVRDGVHFHTGTIDAAAVGGRRSPGRRAVRVHRRAVPRRHRSEPEVRAAAGGRTRRPRRHPSPRRSPHRRPPPPRPLTRPPPRHAPPRRKR